jgi:uncharacterized protein (DUF2252 family)
MISDLIEKPATVTTGATAVVPPQTASIAERKAAGRDLRERTPVESHAEWRPALRRHDPIDLLVESSKGRIEELLPIRYGRMVASPFAFLRGAAAVMAADLSLTPATGVRVQACGDCHAVNFGGFATPERNIIFDINDFDETSPGPWEWDVKRLVASFVAIGRFRNFSEEEGRHSAWRAARSYRKHMAKYAEMPILEAWYDRIKVEDFIQEIAEMKTRSKQSKQIASSHSEKWSKKTKEIASSHQVEFEKLAVQAAGEARILDQPPLIYHFSTKEEAEKRKVIEESFRRYKDSVAPEVRKLLDRFALVDIAAKVVGVGSVGTFCGIILLLSGSGDPLFLQFKEARQSVLEPYAGASPYEHYGERIVRGQRLMQAASDMFLGWMTGAGEAERTFYLRQLKDVKLKPMVEVAIPEGVDLWARYCGHALARAHARSADPVLLSAYMDDGAAFEEAMVAFAVAYADQTESDHEALAAAVRSGRLAARTVSSEV